ncbi:MAG TPA: tRNA lysidine(34) synthetase TilS [Candidatus Angelobacter sp.]|nr:tRNA lysidine(34) synthetase TilS [Candidatus Angelobacter sp.]
MVRLAMVEKVLKYIRDLRLLQPGERIAVGCSGGADSVALLRVLLELRQELGIVLSVAHFHHQIRGAEADADRQFVEDLAAKFQLAFHSGSGDVPAYSRDEKLSLETAARTLRHKWFDELIHQGKADKIATAHTLDDQAETVLMRVLRGSGTRGLAAIAPEQKEKRLVRPLLNVSRKEIEAYLNALQQPWREDSTNLDLNHTRNRVRHKLMPLLETEFNPAIRETLAIQAEVARAEEEYWDKELSLLLPRLVREGKPSRSGRNTSGEAAEVVALDLAGLRSQSLALQRYILHAVAGKLGITLEFKHIQQLTEAIAAKKSGKSLPLPHGWTASCSLRELQFSQNAHDPAENYCYALPIPGEIMVPELGCSIRAQVISAGKQKVSGYNDASLLNPSLLAPELKVRNWRAGDRFFPAHSHSPRKVKELLQPSRLGRQFSPAERKAWPVIESAGQIVWMRGFPVPQAFAGGAGEAVLIEELMNSKAEK